MRKAPENFRGFQTYEEKQMTLCQRFAIAFHFLGARLSGMAIWEMI